MTATGHDLLEQGRAALQAGDAAEARQVFEQALAQAPERTAREGAALEGLARACYLELDFSVAIETWERAYAAYRAAGDRAGAVRVARTLGGMHVTITGDWAVAGGWLTRARTLLGTGDESPEHGWVVLNIGMSEPDRVRKDACFREALAVARRHGDPELELAALAYLGASLVHGDRVDEGMAMLDEALAATAGSEVDDFCVLEEIFCQLFSACEHAHDVTRADQWIRVGEAIAARRKLPAVSAFCRTHYGAVLTEAGRWTEADAALNEAVRLWGVERRAGLQRGALVRLADLRVRQGRFEEAEQLLAGMAPETDVEVAPPLAAIHLARGETAMAVNVLERALAQVDPQSTSAARLHALMVEAYVAAGRLDRAAAAADQLAGCAARHPSHYLDGLAALARGRVCVATGSGDPLGCLREALAGFARAGTPMESARTRLALAAALRAEAPEVAVAEARGALQVFERLHAARDADLAAALLRSLGARTASPRSGGEVLTRREAEVLDLLGHGLSNPEISERLFISRKTVEHHVGNVLVKLGLRSRAEAAAYAARAKPGGE